MVVQFNDGLRSPPTAPRQQQAGATSPHEAGPAAVGSETGGGGGDGHGIAGSATAAVTRAAGDLSGDVGLSACPGGGATGFLVSLNGSDGSLQWALRMCTSPVFDAGITSVTPAPDNSETGALLITGTVGARAGVAYKQSPFDATFSYGARGVNAAGRAEPQPPYVLRQMGHTGFVARVSSSGVVEWAQPVLGRPMSISTAPGSAVAAVTGFYTLQTTTAMSVDDGRGQFIVPSRVADGTATTTGFSVAVSVWDGTQPDAPPPPPRPPLPAGVFACSAFSLSRASELAGTANSNATRFAANCSIALRAGEVRRLPETVLCCVCGWEAPAMLCWVSR